MTEVCETRTAVVVEDDEDIRALIHAVLTQAGFTVHAAATGAEGVELVREHQPVVTTLDISLPDIDGFEVARRLRSISDTYVVMLTARAEEIDTLLGLEAGADDYLTKPFRPRELRARIEAMLRRPRHLTPAAAAPAPAPAPAPTAGEGRTQPGDILGHNGLRMDLAARLVQLDGTPVHLTRSEFDLLAALLTAAHRVLAKAELVREMWGEEYATDAMVTDADKRTLEVHMANLRRKLGEDTAHPRFVETVRGVGYRLTPAR
ncbi:response regulator transcription factor [Georgenia sp. SYP-B2076]|uniref:response regulator transcription factor n=1 Tax=Georgenia sp. SYP-B2076 TaxID=2495881 RepID=UPI000F8D0737|nr:response regulator transcription factor [Georgenia sp. SYP-B2076]